jgi:hypothetical protein
MIDIFYSCLSGFINSRHSKKLLHLLDLKVGFFIMGEDFYLGFIFTVKCTILEVLVLFNNEKYLKKYPIRMSLIIFQTIIEI